MHCALANTSQALRFPVRRFQTRAKRSLKLILIHACIVFAYYYYSGWLFLHNSLLQFGSTAMQRAGNHGIDERKSALALNGKTGGGGGCGGGGLNFHLELATSNAKRQAFLELLL
jgi:hypothetical protein